MIRKGLYEKEWGARLKKAEKKTTKSGASEACALNIL
jgi:hypothetical protein